MTKKKYMPIVNCLKEGDTGGASILLTRRIKEGALDHEDKLFFSQCYMDLGHANKALRMLGAEIPPNQLGMAGDWELAQQFYIGYVLQAMGASYYSHRILSQFNEELKQRKLDLKQFLPRFYIYRFLVSKRCYELSAFKQQAEMAINIYPREYFMHKIAMLEWIGSMVDLGEIAEADSVAALARPIFEKMGPRLQGLYYERLGEIEYFKQNYQKSREYFLKGLETGQTPASVVHMSCNLAKVYVAQKDFASAKKILSELEHNRMEKFNPRVNALITYLAEQLPDTKVGLKDKISLRCHITYNPYAHAVGRKQSKDILLPLGIEQVYREHFSRSNRDCWLVRNGKISAETYAEMAPKYSDKGIILDLYAGFIKRPLGKRGTHFEILTDKRARLLHAVLGAGSSGVHLWSIVDFVYRQNFFDPSSAPDRLKILLRETAAMGFKINRRKNLFYADIPEEMTVVFPMDLARTRLMDFVLLSRNFFTREELEEMFKISKETANRWIKEWLQEGEISILNPGYQKKEVRQAYSLMPYFSHRSDFFSS